MLKVGDKKYMKMDFYEAETLQIGDSVVCLEHSQSFWYNVIYKVKGIRKGDGASKYIAILTEIDSKGSLTNGWNACNFRKASKEEGQYYERYKRPVHIAGYTSLQAAIKDMEREIGL